MWRFKRNEKSISFNEMSKYVENYSAIVIDVRSKQEFMEGHVNGAINVPLFLIKNTISKITVDKDAVIIVYCSNGVRSYKAMRILNKLGYTNVYNLK